MTKCCGPLRLLFQAGLRAPATGRLMVHGVGLADIVARRYAQISTAPSVQPAAQQQVLQAVSSLSNKLSAAYANVLGDAVVTAAEVEKAICGTAPGKAPGLDGVPGELFRQFRRQLAPILARLYTAIGSTHACPVGFLDGVVIPVLKPEGDAVDVDSYRPLQLLCYDYRILAKVLANRLLAVAGSIIDPAQCAFLYHRHIGDSIRLLQMLPAWLKEEQRSAIAAFLDFRKAYDTLSREFLYSVASALGVGDGFVSWMKLLLTHTYSCAVVNGFKSSFYLCSAGVRQGCPLAPLIYLFVGQALLCTLRQEGVGVSIEGSRVTAAQYADDAEPLLEAAADALPFEQSMAVFGNASGQHMQPRKSHYLHMGHTAAVPLPLPPGTALQVVGQAKSLGIIFGGDGVVGVNWVDRMQIVRDRLQRISRIPNMSAFGRAFAANAYAMSTLLYGAQFTGSLPQEHGDTLQKWVAALVDAGLGPADDLRRPPGIPQSCMAAHPREGGFGLLPVRQHLLARLAVEAVQLAGRR